MPIPTAMSSVTSISNRRSAHSPRSPAESFHVSAGKENAHIYLSEWAYPADGEPPRYGGEIVIRSTLGLMGYCWNDCGDTPFKEFLLQCDFDYFMAKTFRESLTEYDGVATLKGIKARVCRFRRAGDLGKNEAERLWSCLLKSDQSAIKLTLVDMVRVMGGIQSQQVTVAGRRFCNEPWELAVNARSFNASRFWELLWPQFTALLHQDLAEVALVQQRSQRWADSGHAPLQA